MDFLDLGASRGGSVAYCAKRFGGTGIGIDNDAEKVRQARENGFPVVLGNVMDLGIRKRVRFVSALDFLEHMPDAAGAEAVLASAAEAATDFLFVHHPSFEGEHRLASQGLYQYWHRWSGHKTHLRIADYCQIFDRLGLHQYTIRYVERIDHSNHPSILPDGSGRNQHEYDRATHPAKPERPIDPPVWRAQRIFVALRAFEPPEWAAIVNG